MQAKVEHATWGTWPSVRLATDALELEVVGEVGARVVSLRDKVRAREWLAQGEPPAELEQMAWAEESVAFWGRESFGWDECLPTVSVCPDPHDPDGPPLRDHGDQWGRGAYMSVDEEVGAGALLGIGRLLGEQAPEPLFRHARPFHDAGALHFGGRGDDDDIIDAGIAAGLE